MDATLISNIGNKINEAFIDSTALSSVNFENLYDESENDDNKKALGIINDALKGQLGDDKEQKLKKLYALAIIAGKKKGWVSDDVDTDNAAEQVATTIDDTVTRAKVAYKVATGEIDSNEAADYLVDKATSRAETVIEKTFESGRANEIITNGIIVAANFIPFYGPAIAETLNLKKPIIKNIVSHVEKPIKNAIIKGTRFIAEKAKPVVGKVTEKVISVTKNVFNTAKNFLKEKAKSFFHL